MALKCKTINLETSCLVADCNNTLEMRKEGIYFHYFPLNHQLKGAWVENVTQLNTQTLLVESYSIICSEHFDESCYSSSPLKGHFLVYGSVPTIFPHCGSQEIMPTSISVPDIALESRVITKVVVPKIPDMKGTADIRFKEVLIKNIEKTKKNDQNIIYLDQLMDKPNDFTDDAVHQIWLKSAVQGALKNVDYDLLVLADGADNVIGGRTITKISQINPKMVQNSENFAKIKVLMQYHLQKLCEKEEELKTIHELQKISNSKTKEEDYVFEKLQIRKRMRNYPT